MYYTTDYQKSQVIYRSAKIDLIFVSFYSIILFLVEHFSIKALAYWENHETEVYIKPDYTAKAFNEQC